MSANIITAFHLISFHRTGNFVVI